MPIESVDAVHLTEFTAVQPEQREKLFELVKAGQDSLRGSEDCLRCETFLDVENPCKVWALEVWSRAEARSAAAAQIPSEVVKSAMAIMDGAPLSRDLIRPVRNSSADGSSLS